MGIRDLLIELTNQMIREHFSKTPIYGIVPRIYPPATRQQIAALGEFFGQDLEQGYSEFLALTDGLDGFYPGMRILGCRDWLREGSEGIPIQYLEILRESGTPADVGLPGDVNLSPVAIDSDGTDGIFMLKAPEILPERFWWIGEGSSSFFGTFADLLGFAIDPLSYSPRGEVT
ncbi:SMI1/KNR4 family protein [Streptomyces sp. Act143]|uniref:SMI1/KNR4 family protein n=1 Tax=Streptomyces sp. Act143 TaxID=2200760 RepID=UPI0011B643AE|nr:SMI1/KNR4 family protein [Streptomyces sp. Act143]